MHANLICFILTWISILSTQTQAQTPKVNHAAIICAHLDAVPHYEYEKMEEICPCTWFLEISLHYLWCKNDTLKAKHQLKQAQRCLADLKIVDENPLLKGVRTFTSDLTNNLLEQLAPQKQSIKIVKPTIKPVAAKDLSFFEQLQIDSMAFAGFVRLKSMVSKVDTLVFRFDLEGWSSGKTAAGMSILLQRLDSLYGRPIRSVRFTRTASINDLPPSKWAIYDGQFGVLRYQKITVNRMPVALTIPQQLDLNRTQAFALDLLDFKQRLYLSLPRNYLLPEPEIVIEENTTDSQNGFYLTLKFN
jgi:hypothetical protein